MLNQPGKAAEKFMNKSMINGVLMGSLSLFVAVTATYLFTWYMTQSLVYAQTVAFASWMFGHVFLAFNFRSEIEPLTRLGLRSNRIMVFWAIAAVVTLIVAVNIPLVAAQLNLTGLSINYWALAFVVPFAATFWMEIKKLLQKHLAY